MIFLNISHLEHHVLAAAPLSLLLPFGDSATDQHVLGALGADGEGVGVGAVMHGAYLVHLVRNGGDMLGVLDARCVRPLQIRDSSPVSWTRQQQTWRRSSRSGCSRHSCQN